MILIGGSLGGAKAVQKLLHDLPPQFGPAIVVCLHRHRDSHDALRDHLQVDCSLAVEELIDKQLLEPGRVYLAPPDYHALIERGYVSLSIDEPERYARPSIDVLFESGARILGAGAIAVILSGGGSDGARGAALIESRGGGVLVQDPATAQSPEMPTAAIRATRAALVAPLDRLAAALLELTQTRWEVKNG
ncbi:MAG: chemotaxis protein CheB [Steroidobacter sp.]